MILNKAWARESTIIDLFYGRTSSGTPLPRAIDRETSVPLLSSVAGMPICELTLSTVRSTPGLLAV